MRSIAAALILTLGANPVLAQESSDQPFSGASVTLITGIDGQRDFDGWNAGLVYGGQASFDLQSGGLVYGVEGEVTGATGRRCFDVLHSNAPTDRYCAKPGRDLYIGGRLGTVIGAATLVYGKAGYANLRETFDHRVGTNGPVQKTGSGTSDGFRIGAGVEQRLTGAVTVKAEYRYTNYEGDHDRHQGVVGLGVRF